MSRPSMPKSIVPSPTLLKFLRAQTQGYLFFTPNHGLEHNPSSRRLLRRPSVSARSHKPAPSSARSIATYSPASLSLESSVFPLLDALRTKASQALKTHSNNISSIDSKQPASNASPYSLATLDSSTKQLHSRAAYAQARNLSTTPPSSYHEDQDRHHLSRWARFWRARQKPRPTQPLQPNDLPPLSSFLDDGASLGRIGKPINELRLRCTEFDERGNVTLVNGEFRKSELIARYGLLPRDLRKIDSALLPSIVIRDTSILINLLHIRALIKHNRVLVFDAYGSTDSYTQSQFMYDLEGKLRSPESRISAPAVGALPYEFRALEAVLISVTTGLESEFEYVREPVVRVLRELEEDIDRDKLRHLLIYSKKLGTFEQKARLVRDAIDSLLESDEDLAAMYLSEKWGPQQGPHHTPREEDDHTEVEMLLESYHKVCDEIVEVSSNLVSNIRNTEEIVKAILDANRNSLMLLDLKFSIGTLGLGGGTFVAALYGMNLKNFIEESDFGFFGVSIWCTVVSIYVFWYGLKKLRRVQRVSMWGNSDRDDGGSLFGFGQSGSKGIRGRSGWAQLGGLERPAPQGNPDLFETPLGQDRQRRGFAARAAAQSSNASETKPQSKGPTPTSNMSSALPKRGTSPSKSNPS